MRNSNICKFVSQFSDDTLTTTNFVLETAASCDPEIRSLPTNGVYLVSAGSGLLKTDTVEKDLLPGTLFFIFTETPHSIVNRTGLEYMYISFSGGRSKALFQRFGITRTGFCFNDYSSLLPFWKDSLLKANDSNIDLISESVLLYTFSMLNILSENDEDRLLNEILQYIEQKFTDPKLSLNSLAADLRYNPKYLSRFFSDKMKLPFSAYLKNMRIRHAVFLIRQGITSVKNVALLSGYNDPLYFSKVFRATVGMSPSEFLASENNAAQ